MNEQALRLIALCKEVEALGRDLGISAHVSLHVTGPLPESLTGVREQFAFSTLQADGAASSRNRSYVIDGVTIICVERPLTDEERLEVIKQERDRLAERISANAVPGLT